MVWENPRILGSDEGSSLGRRTRHTLSLGWFLSWRLPGGGAEELRCVNAGWVGSRETESHEGQGQKTEPSWIHNSLGGGWRPRIRDVRHCGKERRTEKMARMGSRGTEKVSPCSLAWVRSTWSRARSHRTAFLVLGELSWCWGMQLS